MNSYMRTNRKLGKAEDGSQLAKAHRPDREKVADEIIALVNLMVTEHKILLKFNGKCKDEEFIDTLDQIYALFDEGGIRKDYDELILEMRREFDIKITLAKEIVRKEEREKMISFIDRLDNGLRSSGSWRSEMRKYKQALKEGK